MEETELHNKQPIVWDSAYCSV